jgi:uncharacterized protein YuzE
MRITHDLTADAAYIYFDENPAPGCAKKTYSCDAARVGGTINLDFDSEGRLIGIEVLDAGRKLPPALLMEAEDL